MSTNDISSSDRSGFSVASPCQTLGDVDESGAGAGTGDHRAVLLTIAVPGVADAQEATDVEQQLAERFAPVVMVTPQDHNCDTSGEPFRPSSVDIVLDNPEVFLRQVGNDDPVAMSAPSAADIYDRREGWAWCSVPSVNMSCPVLLARSQL